MATIVAQANGNFSDTATWTGGVVPGAGDIAQTGNYAVTIDASVTCTLNPTGSGYFVVTTGGITIMGDVVMQSSHAGGGLRAAHGSGAWHRADFRPKRGGLLVSLAPFPLSARLLRCCPRLRPPCAVN